MLGTEHNQTDLGFIRHVRRTPWRGMHIDIVTTLAGPSGCSESATNLFISVVDAEM
jgi:hypothetical protein